MPRVLFGREAGAGHTINRHGAKEHRMRANPPTGVFVQLPIHDQVLLSFAMPRQAEHFVYAAFVVSVSTRRSGWGHVEVVAHLADSMEGVL